MNTECEAVGQTEMGPLVAAGIRSQFVLQIALTSILIQNNE